MKHLGSLESTQEARVALGYTLSNSHVSSCSPNFPCASYLDEHTLTHEPIVNYNNKILLLSSIFVLSLFDIVCNCHNHSAVCVYNETVAQMKKSLNIHGNYSGGGVCQNCQVILVLPMISLPCTASC